MTVLRLLTASLILTGVATAQVVVEEKPKTTQQKPKTAGDGIQVQGKQVQDKQVQDKQDQGKQDPGKQEQGKTDAAGQDAPLIDSTKMLQRSLDSAQRELEFLKEVHRTGGLLKRFKMMRKNSQDMSKRFNPEQIGPMRPKKKQARLLGDTEKAGLAADVLFTVESLPVTQQEFDATVAYLKSFPQPDSVTPVETLAIAALIEQKAPQALFAGKAKVAKDIVTEIARRLGEGDDFAALAQQYSEAKASAANGGKRDYLVRNATDPAYGMTAFGLKVGQLSGVVAAKDGFHVLKVLGTKRGETPDQDRVLTAHIVRRYAEPKDLDKVAQRIAAGALDVAFRNDDLRKLAPTQFK